MDISTLTPLITALRAETQEDSISPESLGALLQKVVDVLAQAAANSTVQQLTQWQSIVRTCNSVITSLALGQQDSENVLLTMKMQDLSQGSKVNASLALTKATTNRAGVMTAQHVTDLQWCKGQVQRVLQMMESLQQELSACAESAAEANTMAETNRQRLATVETDVQQMKERIANIPQEAPTDSGLPAFFISTVMKGGLLIAQGPLDEIFNAGLVPYVFRYSKKRHRKRPAKNVARMPGELSKGWHVFYGQGKVSVYPWGGCMFRSNWGDDSRGKYFNKPQYLFQELRYEASNKVIAAFGKKNYNVTERPRCFTFGLAFGLPQQEGINFNMNLLRTNIAKFRVKIYQDSITDEICIRWSK